MNRTVNMVAESRDYYQMNKKRIWVIGVVILLVLILFSVGFISKTVTAQRNGDRIKLVTSIEIKKGDTLWSIASDYMSEEYDDMNEYIEEIKESNGMFTDDIRTGNYIIVPYYADASSNIMME